MSETNNTIKVDCDTTVSRKSFLKQSSLSLLGLGLLPFGASSLSIGDSKSRCSGRNSDDGDEERMRSISYNVFNGCIGYKGINGRELPPGDDSILVKTARDMGQIPKRIMLELALYQPNIINFSEATNEKVLAEMAKMLNLNYAFFPGAKNGEGHFPGSILTTYEIVSAETRPFVNKNRNDPQELFTRHWGKAKLRLPNGKTLTVHSAHLWPFKKEENDTRIRLNEIKELVAAIKYDLSKNSESVLLQGDLNHSPDMEEYQSLKNAGLVDTFIAAGIGDGYTINSIKPSKRIDFIYAVGALAGRIKSCRSLFEGNFRLNNEDPKGYALSDHLPVLVDFEL